MRVHAGVILVGGVGLPWLRDLDYGTQWINRMMADDWPEGVLLEDLSYGAHRVLHRFQELVLTRVVLVGCMPRDIDPPGTIRQYRLDLAPPPLAEVHDRLTEAVMGIIDLDHTLAVVRHWGGFPPDTVVVEVEPEDREFGLGFSETVEATVGAVAAIVRREVNRPVGSTSEAPAIVPPTALMPPYAPSPNAAMFPPATRSVQGPSAGGAS